MGTPLEERGPLAWLPRHSILGRIVHPLFEERRSLAGAMTWIGIGIIIAFLAVAVFASVIAPADPILLYDDKGIPPWTNAPVPRNQSCQPRLTDCTDVADAAPCAGRVDLFDRAGK